MSGKGYLYTLEVLIVASLIFISMTFIFRSPFLRPKTETSIVLFNGNQVLEYLDYNGTLREMVLNNDEYGLEQQLAYLLSKNIFYEVSFSCNTRNIPENKEVMVSSYYLAGNKESYNYNKICLFMWRKY